MNIKYKTDKIRNKEHLQELDEQIRIVSRERYGKN